MAKIQNYQLFDFLVKRLCSQRNYETITNYNKNSYKKSITHFLS